MGLLSTGAATSTIQPEYSHTIRLVRNDTLPEISMTLVDDSTSTAVDLTTASSIVLKFRAEGGTVVKADVPVYITAPATDGNIFFQWPEGVLDTAGIFTGEIEITYSDGGIQTIFDELRFEVREDY